MPAVQQSAFDVAVVGGGPVGLAIAWRAAQRGLSVCVLERDTAGSGAAHVAAGMLAPVAEAEFADRPGLRLGMESAARYPAFVAELQELTGLDVDYRACGTLLLARDRDEAEELDRELAFRRELGLDVERLLPSEARRREPALAPALRLAVEVRDDHAIDPRLLVTALAAAARASGAEVREGAEVLAVTLDGDRVTGVELTGGERIAAGQVVAAAGCWSGGIEGIPTDARMPVRPVKGQLLVLRDPAGPGAVTRVLRMETGYLVPRGDGRYVLGASVEERGFDTTVTVEPVHELLRDAAELVPAIGDWEIVELLAGLRPGMPDNTPAVGRGMIEGLVWATGHYRNGVLLTPLTADLVAPLLVGEDPGELAHGLDPARFAGSGAAPASAAGVAA